jgi:hypothetical protein
MRAYKILPVGPSRARAVSTQYAAELSLEVVRLAAVILKEIVESYRRLWQGVCHRLRRETIVRVLGKFRRVLCEVTGWEGDCTEDQSSLREPVNS